MDISVKCTILLTLLKHEMNFNIFIIFFYIVRYIIIKLINISYFNEKIFFCQTLDIAHVYKNQKIWKKLIVNLSLKI